MSGVQHRELRDSDPTLAAPSTNGWP